MEDRELLDVIQGLVAEGRWLREQRDRGVPEGEHDSSRLAEIEKNLDQMWAQLRRRRAERAAADDVVDLRDRAAIIN